MKAILLKAPGSIGITNLDHPECKSLEALIKVKAMGICGSDINAYRGTNPLVTYPRIIGHEIAGEIVKIAANKQKLQEGDHVIIDPYMYCGHCYPCTLGRTNCCENLSVLGVHVNGGMQEYFTHPQDMLTKVPASLPWQDVPLAEPITIALHAIHRTGLRHGEHIVINGAGAIGILTALCAKIYGAIPIIIDLVEERLELARTIGIRNTINLHAQNVIETVKRITYGRMAEVVVEASGANSAILATLDLVSYAGRIALTGWPKDKTLLPTDMITRKEVDIRGSRTSAGEFAEAVSLLAEGKIDAGSIISKVISFEEIPSIVKEQADHPDRYIKVNALAEH